MRTKKANVYIISGYLFVIEFSYHDVTDNSE